MRLLFYLNNYILPSFGVMEAVNFPERLLNGDWNCTSGNWFYIASHYCKNYQFYSFQKMLRKSQIASRYCKNYQFHTFKPSGQKLLHITAKITDFIFSTHCPENHYCKNYQFHISRPMPRKNFQFYISRPVPRKSSNLSQLTVCLTVSG